MSLLALAACAASAPRCNLYVLEQAEKRNIYLPQTNANGIDNYLRKSGGWRLIPRNNGRLDHAAALLAARKSKMVIAAYNTGSSKQGHVAVVDGKKNLTRSSSYKAEVPFVSGSVKGGKPKTCPLSEQFSRDKQPKMNYYEYK